MKLLQAGTTPSKTLSAGLVVAQPLSVTARVAVTAKAINLRKYFKLSLGTVVLSLVSDAVF